MNFGIWLDGWTKYTTNWIEFEWEFEYDIIFDRSACLHKKIANWVQFLKIYNFKILVN